MVLEIGDRRGKEIGNQQPKNQNRSAQTLSSAAQVGPIPRALSPKRAPRQQSANDLFPSALWSQLASASISIARAPSPSDQLGLQTSVATPTRTRPAGPPVSAPACPTCRSAQTNARAPLRPARRPATCAAQQLTPPRSACLLSLTSPTHRSGPSHPRHPTAL